MTGFQLACLLIPRMRLALESQNWISFSSSSTGSKTEALYFEFVGFGTGVCRGMSGPVVSLVHGVASPGCTVWPWTKKDVWRIMYSDVSHVWNGEIFDHTDCSWLNITTPHWSSRRKFFSWVIEPFETPADGGSWDPGWGWKATNGRFAGSMRPRVESELPASWFKWLLQRTKDRAKHFAHLSQLNSVELRCVLTRQGDRTGILQ